MAFRFDWSRLLPPLTLHLHLAAEDLGSPSDKVARWEGEGPVTHHFVHDQLRPLHRHIIRPVIDLAGQAPEDAYEVSERHRRAVRLRSPADYFPFTSSLDPRVDVDHVLSHAVGGTSQLEN